MSNKELSSEEENTIGLNFYHIPRNFLTAFMVGFTSFAHLEEYPRIIRESAFILSIGCALGGIIKAAPTMSPWRSNKQSVSPETFYWHANEFALSSGAFVGACCYDWVSRLVGKDQGLQR